MKIISSLQNEEIKFVAKLHQKKDRDKSNQFIIEGYRAIETAINTFRIKQIYLTEKNWLDRQDYIQELIAKKILDINLITLVSDKVMKKISSSKTPSGILAIFEIPNAPDPKLLSPGIVLAGISDPGNMGTLIRTTAACNLKTVVIIQDQEIASTDPWSPKVVQASAGTIALVNIFQWDWQTLIKYKKNLKLNCLVVNNGKSIKTVNSKSTAGHASLLVIGSEAHGLPKSFIKTCDNLITLPMPGKTESLNAAIAGSIALYNIFVL